MKFFAQGQRYDEPENIAIERIMNSGTKFKFTNTQAHVILTGFKGLLNAALEALGFNQLPNPDELVNEWLDQTMPDSSGVANKHASDIISKLITEQI